MLDEIKCVTPNPIAHMPIRIAKGVYESLSHWLLSAYYELELFMSRQLCMTYTRVAIVPSEAVPGRMGRPRQKRPKIGYRGLSVLCTFLHIALTCWWNLRSLENVMPRWVWLSWMGIIAPPKVSTGGVCCCRCENVCWTVFVVLNFDIILILILI